MKKVYNLLLLAVMFVIGATAAQAEKRYWPQGGTIADGGEWTIDDVETGVQFVLQNGSLQGAANDFVAGVHKTTTITEDNLFELVAAGENEDGLPAFYLKKVSTGEFLASNGTYVAAEARAWKLCVKEAVTYSSSDEIEACEDFTSATLVASSINQLVFVDASAQAGVTEKANVKFLCSNSEGKDIYFGNSFSQNVWNVFPVEELAGADYINDALSEIFPDNTADLYDVGDQPGQISEDLANELLNSYADAQTLAQNWSDANTQEEAEAAVARCRAALQAAKDGAVLVQAGYYYFGGTRTESNAVYDDGTSGAHWTYNQTWERPEKPTASDTKYIWKLTENPEARGSYFVQNVYTGRYLGVATSRGQAIPMTDEAKESYKIYPQTRTTFVIESVSLIANPVEGWNGVQCTALHQPGDHNNLVVWTTDAEASGWKFYSVPQSDIDDVYNEIENEKNVNTLSELYDEALASYKKGFSYKSNATADDDYTSAEGALITSATQLFSNAQESTEGSFEALVDEASDPTTFFHSDWHGGEYTGSDYHYLGVALDKAVQNVQFKLSKRVNPGDGYRFASNFPTQFEVYACNDTTDIDNAAWVLQGTFEPTYNIDLYCEANDSTYKNGVGMVSIAMDAAYKYVRLDVKKTNSGSKHFSFSALQGYEAAYDAATSLIEAVPADVRKAFEDQLAAAKAAIEAKKATTEDIENLQKAYDNFTDNYPDPDLAKEAVENAKTFLEGTTEGDGVGFYEDGAKSALEEALAALEAQIKDVMSVEEVNAVKDGAAAAVAAFNAKMHTPVSGYYYLQSKSTSTATVTPADAFVYSPGNGAQAKWAQADDNLAQKVGNIWKLNAVNGTFTLQNVLTGEYLNNPHANNAAVKASTDADTCAFTLQSARVEGEGYLNIVFDESIYLNAQPGYYNMVTWGAAQGADNSAFTFVEADPSDFASEISWAVASNSLSIVTLPVAVESDGMCYSVIGRNTTDNTLELATIEQGTTIEAGTPFFYNEESGYEDALFTVAFGTYDDFTWATEAKAVNGLQGVLAAESAKVDYGVLVNGAIVDAVSGDNIAHNSGYVLPTVPATEETGDLSVKIEGTISAINTVSETAAAKVVDVYSLSGVKVRANVKAENAVNGLSSGIYIVGGKKVLVK